MIGRTLTTADVAERLRCSTKTVRRRSAELGIGVNLAGQAGYRYTEADVDLLWESMRPEQPVARRSRRGRRRSA